VLFGYWNVLFCSAINSYQKLRTAQLHKYLYTHDNPVNFVDPTGFKLDEWGNSVHHQIGLHFQLQDPESHLNNATIAQILTRSGKYKRGMAGNRKQPDLTDLETKEIYEIKSERSRAQGAREIYTYLSILHRVDPDWKAGNSYSPPSLLFIPEDVGSIYFTFPSRGDGVITYKRFNWRRPLEIVIATSIIIMTSALVAEMIRRSALSQRTLGLT
jgi:hypothetical protein